MVPSIAEAKVGAGGFIVLRPDSGDPVETVLAGLEAVEKVFGVDVNSKGYKVPRGCGVIQGDGINLHKLSAILTAVLEKGFSAEVCMPHMVSVKSLPHKISGRERQMNMALHGWLNQEVAEEKSGCEVVPRRLWPLAWEGGCYKS